MEDKEKHLSRPYISTPFAYTRLSKNLTLLQQSMLNKVSEHLQKYIQYYYGSDLKLQTEKPRSLFSQAEKNHGLPVFLVSYAELGVGIANFNVAKKAVDEVLSLTIEAPGKDKDGKDSIVKQLVFSSANMSYNESTGIAFTLNPVVVDWVFDMSQGYVRHPADIARIGQVERMPMMYYYLFKKSEKWKNREVPLKVSEIKDYLGLLKSVRKVTGDGSSRGRSLRVADSDDMVEIKEAYPKFSQFKKNVLETSINDINRLCYDGLLDVCVSYEPVYNGKRKVGNPEFIKFCIYDSIEEMQKATRPQQQTMAFDESSGSKPKEQSEVYTSDYINEWNAFMAEYSGGLLNVIQRGKVLGKSVSGWLTIEFDKNDADVLLASDEWNNLREDFKKVIGCKYGPGIQILTRK